MEPSKIHNSQAAHTRPPSKLSIMERASPGQETPEARKDTVEYTENVQGNGHRLNTPPYVEVSSSQRTPNILTSAQHKLRRSLQPGKFE